MYDRLLKKSEKILKDNMYAPGEYLWGNYRLISPDKDSFFGVWNWDSAFHAIGMIPFDIDIAKEQIEGFFEFQADDGMLADAVMENGSIYSKCTKPPVMAYAVKRVYEACKDIDFIKRMYPKLVKNEQFWVTKRKYGKLFYYDAVKALCQTEAEYIKVMGFDSGWDNSPRWDASPQKSWAIDLNCYMVDMYRALSYFTNILGYSPKEWEEKEKELVSAIEETLWDDNAGAYVDYNFEAKKHSEVLTPASFMPLLLKTASEERAEKMAEIARRHFMPGMPTVAYDDLRYDATGDKSYWRGPCWLNVAYFAAKGLKNYGYTKEAEKIRDTILEWVDNDGEYIHENYNAKTGEGYCAKKFSWSAVFVREFILNL